MTDSSPIRTALERNVRAVTLRPSIGQGTKATKVRLRPGLACDVEDGDWRFIVGMPDEYGGSNAGPNPGVYGRAALGSCLAIGYGMWAARLGVPIDELEVEVQGDFDARGELGMSDDVPPGYLAMRYIVTVKSSASEADVMRVLDIADKYSSWRDDITRPVPLTREVRVVTSERTGEPVG